MPKRASAAVISYAGHVSYLTKYLYRRLLFYFIFICFAAVKSVNNVLSQNGKPGVTACSEYMKVILSLNENIGRLNNHVNHSRLC